MDDGRTACPECKDREHAIKIDEVTSSNARWKVRQAWRRYEGNIVFARHGARKGWAIKVLDKDELEAMGGHLLRSMIAQGWKQVSPDEAEIAPALVLEVSQ